jgi:CO/xanthine dehydrogenase Mo-binding subunit
MSSAISRPIPRLDGKSKARGEASYIGDYAHQGVLTARFYRSPFCRGLIRSIKLPELPEGYFAVDHRSVPGANEVPLIKKDWPAFAVDEIRYVGQIILVLAGPDPVVVDELLGGIEIDYEEQDPAVTLDEAIACKGGPIHGEDNIYADLELRRGDPEEAFASAARIIEGEYSTGFQEQLYMETQGLMVHPDREAGRVTIEGSMQCPYYVKHAVEHVMGDAAAVRVKQATTGGGFGGKEDYPEIMGAPLSVAAWTIGKPLRMIFDRSEDLAWTSKRHPSRTRVRTAHDDHGRIVGLDFDITLDGGAYESYSLIVLQRAMFTSNGVYNFPNLRVHGRAVATNTVPSGAFRGFGAPQAIFALEMHMERVARELGLDPLKARRPYFVTTGDPTVTGGKIRDKVILDKLIHRAFELSDFEAKWGRYEDEQRRRRVGAPGPGVGSTPGGGAAESVSATAGTAASPVTGAGLFGSSAPRRGIGISLFNHGCGFTGDGEQRIIKGRLKIRKDEADKVEILAATIDMGQGPKTTFRKVAARILGIHPEDISFENPDTDKVPDSGPTVASRTMMVVGYLLQQAAEQLRDQWKPGEAQEVDVGYKMPPGMKWDQNSLTGDAYASFGWGVNVVEVEVDPVSWELHITGAWGVYDVGVAIDERVVHGQIHGGMSQALGYGYLEKLEVDERGVFKQASMADYIVPTSLDLPRTGAATVDNPYEYGPFGAKGMGEMVHDGGHAALAAAVSQALGTNCDRIPLSPETILRMIEDENRA